MSGVIDPSEEVSHAHLSHDGSTSLHVSPHHRDIYELEPSQFLK